MAQRQGVMFHMDGIEAANDRDWIKALSFFQQVDPPSSAVTFNIGMCHMQLSNFNEAASSFEQCTIKDRYLAAAHFQHGVALAYLTRYGQAIDKMANCLEAMRGNSAIDYKQLGMKYKLFACDVQMNIGVLYLFNENYSKAGECLEQAVLLPRDENKHFYINSALDALTDQNWSYFGDDVFHRLVQLPLSCFFAPSKSKMEGIKTKSNFRQNAKVVSATDDTYSFVGFVGPRKLHKDRQNGGTDTTPSSNMNAPPPLPTMAPPRKSTIRSSSPSTVPPMPTTAPPKLNKPHSSPMKQSAVKTNRQLDSNDDALPLSNKAFDQELSQFTKSKPSSRPPPPNKQSFSNSVQCNLTLKINLQKKKINTYQDFLEALATTCLDAPKKISGNSANIKLSSEDSSKGTTSQVNENTWREVFLQAVRNKVLNITLNLENQVHQIPSSIAKPVVSPKPSSTTKTSAVSKPTYKSTPPPTPDDEDFYVDAKGAGNVQEETEENVYSDANYHDQNQEKFYTTTVLPRFR